MFLAQLYHFLVTNHHAHWAHLLFTHLSQVHYDHILDWATRHGFRFHP